MSTNFASLGIAVESSQAAKAADDLDKLVDSAEGAQKAIDDLGKQAKAWPTPEKRFPRQKRKLRKVSINRRRPGTVKPGQVAKQLTAQ